MDNLTEKKRQSRNPSAQNKSYNFEFSGQKKLLFKPF